MPQKILYILRHAKTETAKAGQEDFDRALVPRGVEASRAIGEYMQRQNIQPEKVLCSTALRARQTWKVASQPEVRGQRSDVKKDSSLTSDVQHLTSGAQRLEYTDKLYLATANEILNVLAHTPEHVHSLLIVGHNPGFHELAIKLAKSGDKTLLDILAVRFPTCALATIVFDGVWKDIGGAKGKLTALVTPKEL